MNMPAWVYNLPWDAIRKISGEFSLDPYIIAAIVMAESSGTICAIRYEPEWRYHYNIDVFANRVGSSFETEKNGQATSWGLMQVMGTVAREHGFDGWFPELCDAEKGLYYGCKHFDLMFGRYRNLNDAIAAYNAGSVRKVGSHYVNQSYVDRVLGFYNTLREM